MEEIKYTLSFFFHENLMASAALISIIAAVDDMDGGGRNPGSINIPRTRIPVRQIFKNLGKRHTRKAYRMTERSFWVLFDKIEPYMMGHNKKKRKRGKTPNGDIDLAARLSMALRYFAGGEPIDIIQTHGVGYYKVYTSVWNVVDAINACPLLSIKFPTHEQQKEIAAGFKKKSWVNFGNCIGCIDGMLVWTNKPNEQTLRNCDIGPTK